MKKNHLTAFYIKGSRPKIVKSELDYRLINQNGRVAYVDCKNFQDDHFVYSQIDQEQIDRAVIHNQWNVPSGFVVWFRKVNKVEFFSGSYVLRKGPGTRFCAGDGIPLGRFERFDLNRLFSA